MGEMGSCMAGTSQRCKRKKGNSNAEMQVWSLFKSREDKGDREGIPHTQPIL